MLWVALVIKDNLVDRQSCHDIVFAEADTKDEAIRAIVSMEWPESWWRKGSVCRVKSLFPITEIPGKCMATPLPTPSNTMIRRRRMR
jgi:hypothetical protein